MGTERLTLDTGLMVAPGGYVVRNGVAQRRGRADINLAPPVGFTRPTGSPYVRYEDVHVGAEDLQTTAKRLASTDKITFPAATYSLGDFKYGTQDAFRTFLAPTTPTFAGWVGSGPGQTVITQTPNVNTHTKATAEGPGTNQLYMMNFNHTTNMEIAGFTLQGTDQSNGGATSQYYNGLGLNHGSGGNIHDMQFWGCGPGYASAPPGETFMLQTQNQNSVTFTDVVFDGRQDGASGTSVSASNIGANSSNDYTFTRVKSQYTQYGTTWAMYQMKNLTFVDCEGYTSHSPIFNLERIQGTVIFVRPKVDVSNCFIAVANDCGATNYDTFQTNVGYAKIFIYDPVIPAGQTQLQVRIYYNYASHPGVGAAYLRAGGSRTGGVDSFTDPYHDITCMTGGVWDDASQTYIGGTVHNELIRVTG